MKLLGIGEVSKKLTVRVHAISATAREKIEAAGGTVELLREPKVKKVKHHRKAKPARPRSPKPTDEAPEERGRAEDAADDEATGRGAGGSGGVDVRLARQRVARPRAAPARALHRRRCSPSTASARGFPRRASTRRRSSSLFSGGGILTLLNLFSGSALSRFSLFALGIMPYVTASIIVQLLTVVDPDARAAAEGGRGRLRQDHQYTRYLTVALAAAQATGYAFLFKRQNALPNVNAGRLVIIILTLTAGTALLMWMGEQITKRGIGNGISLLIFASILAYAPTGVSAWINGGTIGAAVLPDHRARRSSSRSSSCRRASGGFRCSTRGASSATGRRPAARPTCRCASNMAGVIPIIFAAAIMPLPPTIGSFVPAWNDF